MPVPPALDYQQFTTPHLVRLALDTTEPAKVRTLAVNLLFAQQALGLTLEPGLLADAYVRGIDASLKLLGLETAVSDPDEQEPGLERVN